ncbi:MAG: phosphatidate cytidylyltransferase [Oscillospiraceae bacterium]
MKTRIIVAAIGAPLLVWVLIFLPPVATLALLMALLAIGAHELMQAVTGKSGGAMTGIAIACALLIPLAVAMETGVIDCGLSPMQIYGLLGLVALVLLFGKLIFSHGTAGELPFSHVSAALFAGFAIPLMLTCLLRLRVMENGQALVMVPLVAAFGSDTFAYFVGISCGKHKLIPLVSPKKTVEGCVGGFAGGVVGMLLFRWIAKLTVGLQLSVAVSVLLGLLGSAMGQLGDLSFSVIKREFGVKDFGKLLPGHGGVLDRFDSVIFVAPMLWFLLTTWGGLL